MGLRLREDVMREADTAARRQGAKECRQALEAEKDKEQTLP